jgi:two-component system cell cycle response regulator DivK
VSELTPRVLYLIDERATTAFVEHWVKKAVEPATVQPDRFDAAAAADMRELLARVVTLQQLGFVCEVGTTGPGAIDRVLKTSPTLIILDVVGYHRTTRRFQRDLKRDPATRGVPLIIVTSDGRPSLRDRAAEIGCEGYLVKPALPTQLYTELRRIGVAVGASPFGSASAVPGQ